MEDDEMRTAACLILLLTAGAAFAGAPPAPVIGPAVTPAPAGGSGFQDRPDAAFGPSTGSGQGGDCYLIVWQDGADGFGENSNILAARVSAEGSPLDPSPLVVCPAARPQRCPRVAWNPEANIFLVVWEDQRSGPAFDIYAARVAPDGEVLDPGGFPVAQSKDRSQIQPDVTSRSDGFVVVWMEYWTYPVWGIFGARVSPDGSVLDPKGVALRKKDPPARGYLFPRVTSRNGRTWMSCIDQPGGSSLSCIELTPEGTPAVVGKPKLAIFGFSGPRGYGLAIGPDGRPFGTGTANYERGMAHERVYYCTFYDTDKRPGGGTSIGLRNSMPWHGRGRTFAGFASTAAFDGEYFWVVYGFGHRRGPERTTVSDIIAFRVDPKEPLKALDVRGPAKDGGPGVGSITIADSPDWECHPEIAEGPAGRLLVVCQKDRGPDDCRIEARVIETNPAGRAR
jgi:hypothetical protein